jgi:hypothetical protein
MATNQPDRLDRVEALLEESNARSIERFERLETSFEQSNRRLDRVEALSLENSQQIRQNGEQLRQTVLAVDRLANAQMELVRIFNQEGERTQASLDSVNAALERIDRVLDYLVRRDRPQENPE